MSTCRSRSPSACSAIARAWLRSAPSTRSSGNGSSPATKSPKTASSWSPTGWSRLADARAADRTSRACSIGSDAPVHLLHPLDDVDGHADRPRLVGERARDRLPDPPGRVGRELEAAAPVELLDGADQA